jgi:hypothetical protein
MLQCSYWFPLHIYNLKSIIELLSIDFDIAGDTALFILTLSS